MQQIADARRPCGSACFLETKGCVHNKPMPPSQITVHLQHMHCQQSSMLQKPQSTSSQGQRSAAMKGGREPRAAMAYRAVPRDEGWRCGGLMPRRGYAVQAALLLWRLRPGRLLPGLVIRGCPAARLVHVVVPLSPLFSLSCRCSGGGDGEEAWECVQPRSQ